MNNKTFSCVNIFKGTYIYDSSVASHIFFHQPISAFFMEISFTTVGFENGQNLKLIFEKNAYKQQKNTRRVPPKSYP